MRDLRKYAQQTTLRLVFGGLLVVVIVAEILIAIFYGREAALAGAFCILLGLLPLFLIWLLLWGLEWIVRRTEK